MARAVPPKAPPPADLPARRSEGQRLGRLHQAVPPAAGRVRRNLARQAGGACPRLRTVHEYAHVVKANFPNKREKLVELAVGLARVPHDKARAEGDARHRVSQPRDEVLDPRAAHPPAHALEDRVRDVLQRKVHIGHQRQAARQVREDLVAERRRVRVHESKPRNRTRRRSSASRACNESTRGPGRAAAGDFSKSRPYAVVSCPMRMSSLAPSAASSAASARSCSGGFERSGPRISGMAQ